MHVRTYVRTYDKIRRTYEKKKKRRYCEFVSVLFKIV